MSARPIAPCGTKAARNRHRRNNEPYCEACIPKPRPLPLCGTYPAYRKGCRCEPCKATNQARVQAQARKKGVKPLTLAPCGTKAAKQRHTRAGEPCEVCATTGIRKTHPCGTWQARRRHARNNEACEVCDASKPAPKAPETPKRPRELRPCGTRAARQRHKHAGETCDVCDNARARRAATTAPRTPRPLQPCGTPAAVKRHRAHGEPVCDICKQADRERGTEARRAKGIQKRMPNDEFLEELEFLLNAGEGEKRILEALGYTTNPHALHQRLHRAKRHNLATRIFGYELAA